MNIETFGPDNFFLFCDLLAKKDRHIKSIVQVHGYPPMWTRPQTYSTLVLVILEQQVSLASAYAAYKKLKGKTGNITPAKILAMSDDPLRECYLSRQKTIYVRDLANAILNRKLQLPQLAKMPDDEVRAQLTQIKGIGVWTADVYLMQSLQRTDVFPLGDLALVNSIKEVKELPTGTSKENLLELGEAYRPYRTIASMIYWHAYIKKRNIKLEG
jgi:DNA-3-methyladenine glycosylase II